MTEKTLSVGDRIDARCTKCRKIMNHTIVAMVASQPVRVKCNTCQGEHNYKNPTPVKKSKASDGGQKKAAKVARPKADSQESVRREWENLCQNMNNAKAVDYKMEGNFPVDSLINHKIFGVGFVQQVCGPKKILVLFQAGRKLLRCA